MHQDLNKIKAFNVQDEREANKFISGPITLIQNFEMKI